MDQLICWFNPGGLVPHRHVMASMRRFAAEVMPAVRELKGRTPYNPGHAFTCAPYSWVRAPL
jgi:hypothetical protein